MNLNNNYDLAVIGAGPAGMAAAIEASRNNMKVLVLDDQPAAGGQVYRQIDRNYGANLNLLSRNCRSSKLLLTYLLPQRAQ